MRRLSSAAYSRESIGELGDLEALWDDFRDASDDAIEALGPIVLGIVESVLSLFPGIGTALATVLATGIALARGRPIEEVIVTAAAGAIPGGPAAEIGFKTAVTIGGQIARGRSAEDIVINEARANLPAGLPQAVFSAGVNVSRGNDPGDAALSVLRSQLPAGILRTALDVTVKVARGVPVDQAAIDLILANLPPAYRLPFRATLAISKGEPLAPLAIEAAREAARAQGPSALAAFEVSIPLSTGTPIDALALKALRDTIPAPDLAVFDQTIAIAHAAGLQSGGFAEAATFMPWEPGGQYKILGVPQTKQQAIDAIRNSQQYYGNQNVLSPEAEALADKMAQFSEAAAKGITTGETAMGIVFRKLLTDLSKLDSTKFDLFPQIVSHLETYRSDYEHDLQDVESLELSNRYSALLGVAVPETIVRAALGAVPYTIKPPFTSRKEKRRGEADIRASFQRAIPGAMARRARIKNALDLFRNVDARLSAGSTTEQVYAWAHGPDVLISFGGEERELTRDQIYERTHLLAARGLVPDDFVEFHLLDDPTGKAALAWKNQDEFLAAPTLPTAAEYRRRAKLEQDLAAGILEGTAYGKGKELLDKADADLARAASLEMIEFSRLAKAHAGAFRVATPEEAAANARDVAQARAEDEAASTREEPDRDAPPPPTEKDSPPDEGPTPEALAAVAKARQIKIVSIAGAAGALLVLGAVAMKGRK